MSPLASPERQAGCCLLHREIKSATSTAIDFGANHPLHTIPAYVLPVYASQARLPPTTQDSVQDCGLGFVLATIAGSTCSLSFSRRNPLKFRTSGFPTVRLQTSTPPEACLGVPIQVKAPASTPEGTSSLLRHTAPVREGDTGTRFSALSVTSGCAWDVHGSFPRRRLCCPSCPQYSRVEKRRRGFRWAVAPFAAPFGWRCLSTPPCPVSCRPSKILDSRCRVDRRNFTSSSG